MSTPDTTQAGARTQPVYWIEKRFIGGNLNGLSWEGATHTKFEVGFVCNKPVGNTSPYRIVSCKEVE